VQHEIQTLSFAASGSPSKEELTMNSIKRSILHPVLVFALAMLAAAQPKRQPH